MNWLLIIVLLILAAFGLKGRADGFIKTIFSICSIILALVLATVISPLVSKGLQQNEAVYGHITKTISKTIKIDEKTESKTEQIETIDKLSLPKSLINSLKENNNDEMKAALEVGKDNLKAYIVNYLACIVINAISFLGTFLLFLVILIIISNVLNIISRLPLINGLNKTAGLLVGVLKGLVVVWLLCIALTTLSGTKGGQTMFEMIEKSRLLSSIYNNNLLLKFVTDMAKVLF